MTDGRSTPFKILGNVGKRTGGARGRVARDSPAIVRERETWGFSLHAKVFSHRSFRSLHDAFSTKIRDQREILSPFFPLEWTISGAVPAAAPSTARTTAARASQPCVMTIPPRRLDRSPGYVSQHKAWKGNANSGRFTFPCFGASLEHLYTFFHV